MKNDPLELLFARNVRLYLGSTASNNAIKSTYQDTPKEFVVCTKNIKNGGWNMKHLLVGISPAICVMVGIISWRLLPKYKYVFITFILNNALKSSLSKL